MTKVGMEQKLFKLEIISPFKIIYQENVKHIRLPAQEGYLGILASHAPFIIALNKVDLIIDGGKSSGKASTIIDLSKEKPLILREGVIPKNKFKKYLK